MTIPQSPFPDTRTVPVLPGAKPPRYQVLTRGTRQARYEFSRMESGEAVYVFDRMIDKEPI